MRPVQHKVACLGLLLGCSRTSLSALMLRRDIHPVFMEETASNQQGRVFCLVGLHAIVPVQHVK